MKDIQKIIRYCRVTSKYKGYTLIFDAINIYIHSEKDCIKVTKDIYPVLAQKHNMSICSVERNIRTVVETCWKNNRRAVQEIFEYEINKCPSNADFLEAISYFVTNKKD